MGVGYEWEFKRIIEHTDENILVWHIGGTTPGWDNLIVSKNVRIEHWNKFIPIECKSFTQIRRNYKEQVIEQFNRYMDIYNKWNVLTFYALRYKRKGDKTDLVDRWRVIPCTEVIKETGNKGGVYIDYNWAEAMPLKRFIRAIFKKPTKADIKSWPWIKLFG